MFKKVPPPMTMVMLTPVCLALCRQIKNIIYWSNNGQTIIRRGAGVPRQ